MADDRIIALDIGSQQISAAAFSKTSGGGLRLDQYHRSDLVGDPSDDAQRVAQSKMALKEVVGNLKLNKSETKYVISSQPVLLKFASLPAIDGEKLEEIVEFEAQQQVPYPINEVVWGYQLVGDPDDFEVEVILAAVKSDELNEIDELVHGAGMTSSGAEISPVAHYNSLRFNYSDIEEPILLIDIGARTTDLVFMEGGKVFIRTIKLGGSEITKAIAKEFGIDYAVADQKKIADGFVALGGPYADHEDPEIAGMSKIIRNSLTRMHSEIMRTINFYRSQQGGSAPQLALLSGATTALPFIREFFAEKLNIPIDHFNALRNVTVKSNLAESGIGANAHTLGGLVGSALQQAGPVPAAIDLIPASVKADRDMNKRKPALMMSIGSVTALLLALGFFNVRGAALSDEKADSISRKAGELTKASKEIDNLRAEVAKIDQKQEPFVNAVRQRVYWIRAFNYLSNMMESDTMWLTSLTPLSQDEPVIEEGVEELVSGDGGTQIIDTVLIKGLWRENPLSSRVVYNYFNKLKDDAVKAKEAGRPARFDLAERDVSELLNVEAGTEDDRFAYRWELKLPLPVENQIKFTK
ncbi:MAG: pilus assembly protein PilM [Verrucomicrobiales bacterium]|nr:pilus assembly protein PilM [Verrucomicrobiales bacterium]